MSVDRHYKVIISDRAKRMLASHIHFIAQVNRDVAKAKKKEIMDVMRSLNQMLQRFLFLMKHILYQINIAKCLFKNGISFFIKSKMILFMLTILLIVVKIMLGL